ncbi:MAG TPA: hypothetical protein VIQ98_03350 [Gemmatimonadales bacterium]
MPLDKDFKRLIRGRMQKTGESYTAARAVLRKKPAPPSRTAPRQAEPDFARLAGMSDAAVSARTGRTWAAWVEALDAVGAQHWPHRRIAEWVHLEFKIGDWWGQTVAVGYERIKGLREIGQRRDGTYEASRSRTLAVPVARLYRAFTDARLRNRWLPGVKLTIRKATPHKSVRISWEDGTVVEVGFMPKGDARSAVAVAHRKLTDKEDSARRKEFWGERLDALAGLLTPA